MIDAWTEPCSYDNEGQHPRRQVEREGGFCSFATWPEKFLTRVLSPVRIGTERCSRMCALNAGSACARREVCLLGQGEFWLRRIPIPPSDSIAFVPMHRLHSLHRYFVPLVCVTFMLVLLLNEPPSSSAMISAALIGTTLLCVALIRPHQLIDKMYNSRQRAED